MSEKLSQGQIDALLKRLNSGEAPEPSEDSKKKIKEYDFKSPKKFTKEQLRALDSLHENYSRVLSSYLSGLLRVFCEISVLSIEEQRYYEYSNALPDTSLLAMIELRPSNKRYDEATLIMDMSTTVGYFMIDRLLGGSGEGSNLTRDFTDIEISILRNIFQKIVAHMQDVWCNFLEVSAELSSIETNSRLVQVYAPEDIVVIVALNVKIKNLTGTLSICIPAFNLEEMIGDFSMKYAKAAKRQGVENELKKQVILETLNDSEVEIKAVFGQLTLELNDILQLQPDDVIPLSKDINSEIFISVDDEPWYSAKLGETKTKKAVRLSQLIG